MLIYQTDILISLGANNGQLVVLLPDYVQSLQGCKLQPISLQCIVSGHQTELAT